MSAGIDNGAGAVDAFSLRPTYMHTLRVVHTTEFDYPRAVVASHNEARIHPLTDERQIVRSCVIDIKPATWVDEYRDYWGTEVTAFEVLIPHKRLRIVADSVVDILEGDSGSNGPRTDVTWEELASDHVLDEHSAFLAESPTTLPPEEVVELARETAVGLAPAEAAAAICLVLRDQLEYVPGVTSVHTPACDAWAARRGVCQDMAHLCIGALRAIGIPARYVSGYLHPKVGAAIGETVAGESHAWLEYWVGEWVGYDPTNRRYIGTDHVVVARGREYGDVPPLKGVYAGAAESNLKASVEITRLA